VRGQGDDRAVTTTLEQPKDIASLTDEELERELTIAALSSRRTARYEALLAERLRRRQA
jgi:hypothetical protein